MKLPISTFVSLLLIVFAGEAYGQVGTINYSDGAFMLVKSGMAYPTGKEPIPIRTA